MSKLMDSWIWHPSVILTAGAPTKWLTWQAAAGTSGCHLIQEDGREVNPTGSSEPWLLAYRWGAPMQDGALSKTFSGFDSAQNQVQCQGSQGTVATTASLLPTLVGTPYIHTHNRTHACH